MSFSSPQYQQPPSTGGRVELRLTEGQAPRGVAAYTARWTTPDGTWLGELLVNEGGQIEPSFRGEAPPTWLLEFSAQLLRTTARSTNKAGGGVWPRRLTRWRAAPDER